MKYLIALMLLFFSSTALALPNCVTGSWYDPERSGEGLSVEVTDDLVVVYFYTYGLLGKDFLIGVGANDGDVVTLDVTETIAVPDWPKPQIGVGTFTLEIFGDELFFSYDLMLDADKMLDPGVAIPWCIGCSDDLIYKRLTQPIKCE